jgi:hypothetical protein
MKEETWTKEKKSDEEKSGKSPSSSEKGRMRKTGKDRTYRENAFL